jgi:hypothetical protein
MKVNFGDAMGNGRHACESGRKPQPRAAASWRIRYARVGGPNQVVSASASPSWVFLVLWPRLGQVMFEAPEYVA